MIDLSQRSDQKELLDEDNIPLPALVQNLRELNFINTWLGGHAITLNGIQQIIGNEHTITICEIGCGGGDNLFAVYLYCLKKNIAVNFIGIDFNEGCISYAKQKYPQLPCRWICSDYTAVKFDQKPDIIFSSLFCHHFTNNQLVKMLQWLKQQSKKAFFINDLQRHRLPYYLIKYGTKFFSRSYLVKNDACLSVARSFTKEDWINLLQQAEINNYQLTWQWAFRWLIIADSHSED